MAAILPTDGMFGNGDVVAVHCNTQVGEPSPVLSVGWDSEDFKDPKLPSLSAMFQMFSELMGSGAWTWDTSRQRWVTDFERIPMDYRVTSLV